MSGFYVGEREPIVDLQIGMHILTLCAPFAGKIMRCRDIGETVRAGDTVIEVTSVGTPTWELFFAYRRSDAPGHAGRIGERLIGYFGPGQVFKDIESQRPGVDFVHVVREMLQRAFAMVVIIGPRWLVDRRVDDPEDLHREEIRTALERGVHIVPVLVNGASMPRKNELPEDIRPLVRRQAIEITDTRWDYDVGQLAEHLARVLAGSPKRQRFLAQVPPWGHEGAQWIEDDPVGDM
jgi:TIR domain